MKLTADELARIAELTIGHYNGRAEAFWQGTRDHDVSQNIAALLQHIEASRRSRSSTSAAGPGAISKTFAGLGHVAVGSGRRGELRRDGAREQRLRGLAAGLPCARPAADDASTASSPTPSCSTCPARSCRGCCGNCMRRSSRRGVLFSSNPRGRNEEGWQGERYGAYHDLENWRRYLTAAGFLELDHYYRPPGLPRDQQPWLASVWRRADGAPVPR